MELLIGPLKQLGYRCGARPGPKLRGLKLDLNSLVYR